MSCQIMCWLLAMLVVCLKLFIRLDIICFVFETGCKRQSPISPTLGPTQGRNLPCGGDPCVPPGDGRCFSGFMWWRSNRVFRCFHKRKLQAKAAAQQVFIWLGTL